MIDGKLMTSLMTMNVGRARQRFPSQAFAYSQSERNNATKVSYHQI